MTFSSETRVKAVRKRHRCDACRSFIEVGRPAWRWAGLTDGDFGTSIYHLDCRDAEVELNRLHDWRCGDDWISLTELEEDDHEWLIADHPAVAARFGLLVSDRAGENSDG